MLRVLTLVLICCGAWPAAASPATPSIPDAQSQPAASPQELAEAERLNGRVIELYRAGKYDEAAEAARRVLEIRERAHGVEHLTAAFAASNLATVYIAQKKSKEAEALLRRALATGEKLAAGEKPGAPAHRLVIEASNKLGLLRFHDGDYAETQQHFLRAHDLIVASRGAEDPSLVPVLLNLTDLAYQRRRPDEAEQRLARVVEVLLAHEPRRDRQTLERLKRYACWLTEEAHTGLLSKTLGFAIYRLRDPEKALAEQRASRELLERGLAPVQGGVLNGRAVSKPRPRYPAEAREKAIMGTVVIEVTVDEAGRVTNAEPMCGHPLLAPAAVEAARKWRFTPTQVDGQAVKALGTISIHFTLR